MDATPEMVLSILKQLVEVVGAAQSDIFIGDPFRTFRDNYWDLCHSVYPDVNYCDGKGMNGRHRTVPTSADLMVFSDGVYDYRIPQEYVDADYFINMPCLKTHDSGGITLAAKNHQGSILQDGAGSDGQSAQDMHYALPENDDSEGGHHRYRHLVDYMGHEHLGDKTLLVIVDGIWAGKSWQGWVEKWQMEPFSNDYPNSIFLSQDLVAIESVCWDFLLTEYASKPEEEQYPYMEGVEDYILQAADPESRPAGIEYDPEGDGEPIGSLGVYEHWNNATEMEYTAIDFIKVVPGVNALPVISGKNNTLDLVVYPNPATTYVFLEYRLEKAAHVSIEWYSPTGIKIGILREQNQSAGSQHFVWDTQGVPEGIYLVRISADTDKGQDSMVKRISIL